MLLTLLASLAVAAAPSNWSCDPSQYEDGICDCGCTASDSDCSSTNFAACERSGCAGGQVPWEHQNASCMASTCGDGWNADDEACDDGNARAAGGCNADCSAVNDGFACGERATGCVATSAPDAGPPSGEEPDAGSPTGDGDGLASEPSTPTSPDAETEGADAGGCVAVPAGSVLTILGAALLGALRNRRRR